MAYAANFPNRVSQLILSSAQARYLGHPLRTHVNQEHVNQEAFRTLMLSNWRMASSAVLEAWLGARSKNGWRTRLPARSRNDSRRYRKVSYAPDAADASQPSLLSGSKEARLLRASQNNRRVSRYPVPFR